MSQNWMRHFELQLIDDKGDGISLSDFKVTFNIQKMPATIFNGFVGNFKIYNLSPETQNRIMGKEFTRVRAIAGYNGTADSSGNYPDKKCGDHL
ncbi:putative bacteriophage protein [Klebsiella pneumoniae IS43]|uniref:Bacteriophage protein n=1 Tax=Klebsiella pneumoniae IS43 TaxID=1432552 RepID=W1DD75_KLEPN|nr:putative bacteriophage protein [Klebsiella pneumoniae IS43]